MSDEAVTALLERLSSGRGDAAWTEFLAGYSSVVVHVIRRCGVDADQADECFLHVCEALSDGGFRRLRSFRTDGPASFKTWLMAVVANLCIDWKRRENGRVRPFRSVSRLPDLEGQVYRCIFERRMTRTQCLHALRPRFPGLTEAGVAEINARLFQLLTPQQRWQLTVRTPSLTPVTYPVSPEDESPAWQLAEPGPGPDELAEESQEQGKLQQALAKLSADQRLLLRMRYEQNLSLAEIARLTGQADPFRANRRVQAALDALADAMGGQRARSDRKTR
ncbi:MAG: sigma-70 family RNA polymerase sigma factor [Gammaproteobacteria bacterium]|nr:sigma-70 family RNA polymerase sigma factor [Gammaproteobacteria bacterium]